MVSSAQNVSEPVRLDLLGGFRLWIEAAVVSLPVNAQRLVSFLALHDKPLRRAFVAGSLWDEVTQRRASGSLRSALWRLSHPTHSLVELTEDHIQLGPAVAVDLREGRALARRVLDPTVELADVQDMNEEVLSADILPDWTEEWVLHERERYRQLRLRALEALSDRLAENGRYGQAVQAALAAIAGEPLRESAWRAVVRAHLAEGNASAALRKYDEFASLVRSELRVEPSDEMRALIKGVRRPELA